MVKKVTGYLSASGKMFDTAEEAERDELLHIESALFAAIDWQDPATIKNGELAAAMIANPDLVVQILRAGGVQVYLRHAGGAMEAV